MASASYSSKGGGGGGGGSGPGPDFTTAITVTLADAATATAPRALTLTHSTSGISAAGFGTSILFRGEDDGGNIEDMATLNVLYSNTAVGTEGTYFSFSPRYNGAAITEYARIGPIYSSFYAITIHTTMGDLSNRIEGNAGGLVVYAAGGITAAFNPNLSTLYGCQLEMSNVGSVGSPSIRNNLTQNTGFYLNSTTTGMTIAGTGVLEATADGVQFRRGVRHPISTQVAGYTTTASDTTVLADFTAAGDITLLSAVTAGAGKLVEVKRINDTHTVTIKAVAGTLDGVAAATGIPLTIRYQSRIFRSDGTNWHIVGAYL